MTTPDTELAGRLAKELLEAKEHLAETEKRHQAMRQLAHKYADDMVKKCVRIAKLERRANEAADNEVRERLNAYRWQHRATVLGAVNIALAITLAGLVVAIIRRGVTLWP